MTRTKESIGMPVRPELERKDPVIEAVEQQIRINLVDEGLAFLDVKNPTEENVYVTLHGACDARARRLFIGIRLPNRKEFIMPTDRRSGDRDPLVAWENPEEKVWDEVSLEERRQLSLAVVKDLLDSVNTKLVTVEDNKKRQGQIRNQRGDLLLEKAILEEFMRVLEAGDESARFSINGINASLMVELPKKE